jgi:hypothetical protein
MNDEDDPLEWDRHIDFVFQRCIHNIPDEVREYVFDNPNDAVSISALLSIHWNEELYQWHTHPLNLTNEEVSYKIANMAGTYIPLSNRLGEAINPNGYKK